MTDTGRSRVYAAEHQIQGVLRRGGAIEFFGSHLTVPDERRFGNVESVQAYVEKVLAWGPVRDRFPRSSIPLRVRERRGNRMAHYQAGVIALPPTRIGGDWSLREMVVLHEMAHHLCDPGEQHGPVFCGTMATLVDLVIGPEVGWMLRVTLWSEGLKISEPDAR